jgi:hypothetical protein
MVQGIVRGLGTLYTDGIERWEIHISKEFARELPNRHGCRVAVRLIIGENIYEGGIRSTDRNDYIWICPDLMTQAGHRTNLSHILPKM